MGRATFRIGTGTRENPFDAEGRRILEDLIAGCVGDIICLDATLFERDSNAVEAVRNFSRF